MTIFYLEVEPFSKYFLATLDLTRATRILNENVEQTLFTLPTIFARTLGSTDKICSMIK